MREPKKNNNPIFQDLPQSAHTLKDSITKNMNRCKESLTQRMLTFRSIKLNKGHNYD